jgi:PAS fold
MEKAKAEELPLSKILPDMDVYSILMQTPVAICIFRGKEYTIEFANDFYLQILGKSSDIIGKPLFESFPELKNQGFDTLIDGVMESGIPHTINEHAAIISRDDKESLCFFHCVYQPMREQSGVITGVIVVFTEVTELVLAKNKNFENQQKISEELFFSKKELAFQKEEKGKRAAELGIAKKELAFQDDEKEKRAVELIIANKELIFQNDEKEKRAAELIIANKELIFQNDEKGKRADELIVVNKKLEFQNKEKEKRADELFIANQELIFQTGEKEKRAAELVIADIEQYEIGSI